ncbi:cobalamin biosynthesis protein [Roseivivax isoporae]|uniref:Precorrin methylase n=1 Tax=Roseivivax isoporae LMG 25204 TaxID=1449351 RepID=X7F7K1_9RHOB|nr:cobalamin biosynthesis protein [Roseivivax isoporae]ETX28041.1 precorrin methylase [Roseivivax isoporae LMG 25204]
MIVAGFGFRGGASEGSLADALAQAERATGARAQALATVADKCEAPAFAALARATGLPARPVDSAALAAQQVPTRSAASIAARGTGSVAEAAALAAAGPGARLLAPRTVSADGAATCALARDGRTAGRMEGSQ